MAERFAPDVLADVYQLVAGRRPESGEVTVMGDDAVLPGRFRVGAAAAACVGVTTLAAAELFRSRGGDPGPVSVSAWHAAMAFATEGWLRIDGQPGGAGWAELSGNYRAADGWVRLHCNYEHHGRAGCAALGVPTTKSNRPPATPFRGAA
jgi:crotonobetainyl-CoA:carnitine CoA-transferase CaiB-like acyl-CoA transferase